jgi:hypothetical protein
MRVEDPLTLTIWDQELTPVKSFVRLSADGDVVLFTSAKPLKIRLGNKVVSIDMWALATEIYMDANKFPSGAGFVRLLAPAKLKDTEGVEHTYSAKSRLIVDAKGTVYECRNQVLGMCF